MNRLVYIKVVFFTLLLLPLTGCWDNVGLENRGFAVSVGIDKHIEASEASDAQEYTGDESPQRFAVSIALANISALSDKSGGDKSGSVKSAKSTTISSATRVIDSNSSQKLYFGHAKTAILGSGILSDAALFAETIDSLTRNREINRKIILLAADDASGIVSSEYEGEQMTGMYISNYYKNNILNNAVTFKQDLGRATVGLRTDGCVLIPRVESAENGIKLGGAAVIKDYNLMGWLNDIQTRGFLWVSEEASNAVVTVEYDGTYVPLRVKRSRRKINFYEYDGKLVCGINISAEGVTEEYVYPQTILRSDMDGVLASKYENRIKDEIRETAILLQTEYNADCYGFKDMLRKKNYELYKKYANNWDSAFGDMVMDVNINVIITGIGSSNL